VYVRVHEAPAHKVPEPNSVFDFALSNSTLEHVPDIDEVLLEVHRVLKPGASFVFTVPSSDFHACLAGPRLGAGAFGRSREAYLSGLDRRLAHLRYWSADCWTEHLERAGFELKQCRHYMTAAEVRRWELITNWTAGILYALFGKRKQPVEMQRMLGIRRLQYSTLTKVLSAMALRILAIGLPEFENVESQGPYGCLLIEAKSV
jgi:ubiquinone/menaquinone biosynthesis C-methylase UbiE